MKATSSPFQKCAGLITLMATSLLVPSAVLAKLPEPDAIFHGALQVNDRRITAADTDIEVLAVDLADGTLLAAYRMGDEPAAGDRYVLRIPLESLDPLIHPSAFLLGGRLRIEVHDSAGLRIEHVVPIDERGTIRQLSLSDGPDLPDNNGLPDDWEIEYFGSNYQDPSGDPDRDGKTTAEEFTAGTDPTDPDDLLLLEIGSGPIPWEVSFSTRAASGVGYDGQIRFYTLQQNSEIGVPEGWRDVAGISRIQADGQRIQHQPSGDGPLFFRILVSLESQP